MMAKFKQFLFLLVMFGSMMRITLVQSQVALGDKKPDNSICDEIGDNAKQFKLDLKAALIFKENLIFITNDWQVLDIPNHNFLETYGQMLLNVTGVPIKKKWSAFGRNDAMGKYFDEIKDQISTIYSVDKSNPFLFMDSTKANGLRYRVDKNELAIINRDDSAKDGAEASTITSVYRMYMMDHHEGKTKPMTFYQYKMYFHDDGSVSKGHLEDEFQMFYMIHKDDSDKERPLIVIARTHEAADLELKEWDAFPLTDWGLPKGFQYREMFYLFDSTKTYIFDGANQNDDKFHTIYIKSHLQVINHTDYFVCGDTYRPAVTPPPHELQPDGLENLTVGPDWKPQTGPTRDFDPVGLGLDTGTIIIIAVLALLILFCCVVAACLLIKNGRKRHRGQGHRGSGGSHGSKGSKRGINKGEGGGSGKGTSASKLTSKHSRLSANKSQPKSKQNAGNSLSSLKK